jgi:hypothetical protein
MLLVRHESLREEADRLATEVVSAPCYEDVASAVADAVTVLDIQDLNGRAGPSRSGYTDPTDAAWELLEESVEDFISDMKRRVGIGLTDAAITFCRGIVVGLYKVRTMASDGPLGWAPDFPAEAAGNAVAELLRAVPKEARAATRASLEAAFASETPDWTEMLTRVTRGQD